VATGPSYLKSYSSITCNVTLAHDEYVVECTRFGTNGPNPKPSPWTSIKTVNLNTKVWKHLKKVKKWSFHKCNY